MTKIKLFIVILIVGLLFTALLYKDQNPDSSSSEMTQKMESFLDQLMETTQEKMPQLKEETAQLIEEITSKLNQIDLNEIDIFKNTSGFAANATSNSIENTTSEITLTQENSVSGDQGLDDAQMREGLELILNKLKEMESEELVNKIRDHYQLMKNKEESEPNPVNSTRTESANQ